MKTFFLMTPAKQCFESQSGSYETFSAINPDPMHVVFAGKNTMESD
jgi:hypothetical protein